MTLFPQRLSSMVYADHLEFDYIETYSLLRGLEYETQLKSIQKEYNLLEVRLKKRNNLSESELKRHTELNGQVAGLQYLLNPQGQFHFSSIKTHTFKTGSAEVARLTTILKTEIKEVPFWMCSPIYRDAIVFYNSSHEIVSVLNVCLSCNRLHTLQTGQIDADDHCYHLLKQFFTEIGHEVE
ncbi:hypothetical protein [Pedobacter caeni]|uniref:Uncharacterized protein n=1 Tax=Pedobacter caeni TaxID=288992 RepID=A0A1M5A9A6_9SPHI|nr:hypothetical protein [Pedobacter caeni]SHF26755.1 hypothetical protein SAMN04488522_102642 [Pedobacter caeni]